MQNQLQVLRLAQTNACASTLNITGLVDPWPTYTGGWRCGMCGIWVLYNTCHTCWWQQQTYPWPPAQPGWKCPGCGMCNAPWLPYCTSCAPKRPDKQGGA